MEKICMCVCLVCLAATWLFEPRPLSPCSPVHSTCLKHDLFSSYNVIRKLDKMTSAAEPRRFAVMPMVKLNILIFSLFLMIKKKKCRLFYAVIFHFTCTFHPNCDSYMSLMASLPHSAKAVWLHFVHPKSFFKFQISVYHLMTIIQLNWSVKKLKHYLCGCSFFS